MRQAPRRRLPSRRPIGPCVLGHRKEPSMWRAWWSSTVLTWTPSCMASPLQSPGAKRSALLGELAVEKYVYPLSFIMPKKRHCCCSECWEVLFFSLQCGLTSWSSTGQTSPVSSNSLPSQVVAVEYAKCPAPSSILFSVNWPSPLRNITSIIKNFDILTSALKRRSAIDWHLIIPSGAE
jgi:hypothetical protein